MADTTYQPGSYTFKWMVDTRNVDGLRPLRIAQVAAYSLQPRFGSLTGNAVQPTDVEFIKNRLTNDVITGVIRLTITSPQSKNAIEERILTELRTNGVPDAAKHLGSTDWGANAALFAPAIAVGLAPIVGLYSLSGERGRQAARDRFGNVIIEAKPSIDNAVRPASASGPLGAITNQLSNRVSVDPARNGVIGASSVAEIADRASEALSPPTWLIVTLIGAGTLALAAVGFYAYKQVKMVS